MTLLHVDKTLACGAVSTKVESADMCGEEDHPKFKPVCPLLVLGGSVLASNSQEDGDLCGCKSIDLRPEQHFPPLFQDLVRHCTLFVIHWSLRDNWSARTSLAWVKMTLTGNVQSAAREKD